MGHFFYKEQKMSCKLGCSWDINGGHGDGRGHEQARLQRIFCVAITEGATSYWVGLKWDTFSALVRPPGPNNGG